MIAIFTVLGLFLFGGGAYAIYDGWPYLVLERGFTQVIIGSIASSAGLILISLAWVLREIRTLKRSLAEAAQMRPDLQAPATVDVVRVPWEAARPDSASGSSVLVPAAIGAAAGAVAAGAVADTLAMPAVETAPAATEAASTPERDLFGTLVARRLEETEAKQDDVQEEAALIEPAEPLPDMFEDAPFEQTEEADEAPIAIATESHEPAEIVAAKIQPVAEDEALAHAAEPIVVAPPPSEEHADGFPAAQDENKPVTGSASGFDEFSLLRESLAGHLNEPIGTDTRVEPSLAPEADPFAQAEAWMDKASPRKEPWFETHAPTDEDAPEAASLPWPPRTEAPDFTAASEHVVTEPDEEPEAVTASDDVLPEHEVVPEQDEQETPPTTVAAGEDAAEDDPAPSSERAASDEGIVGAYQVGDAHFTIYADGSIQARTPDGEYSFASMDELKVYLASEKSRLGV